MTINIATRHRQLTNLWWHQNKTITPPDFEQFIGKLAGRAMLVEVRLTPKPGLVDRMNSGAHHDMDLPLFEQSAAAITPYLSECLITGFFHQDCPIQNLLPILRPIGIRAEQAMFSSTQGVNTHKGMIFSLGIVCGVVGWMKGHHLVPHAQSVSQWVKACTEQRLWQELAKIKRTSANSVGENLFLDYQLAGARGEVASGFQTVMQYALPAYQGLLHQGYATEQALWQALLVLMANNQDTNLVARGGLDGLKYVQACARRLMAEGGIEHPQFEQQWFCFDQVLIERNLSPGGSADLLAVTWLLDQLDRAYLAHY